jgi:DNA-binding MarR family transcriptional regulator
MIIDPLRELPGYLLRRVSVDLMAKLAARLATLDLRPAEATVLMVIGANPGVTQSEIGRLLDIATANMTPLAVRLRDRELIVRERVDGRSHGLKLSESGRRLTQRARHIMEEFEAELLGRLPTSQRAPFLSALRTLAAGRSALADDAKPRRARKIV